MNPVELDRALRKLRLSGMAATLETRLDRDRCSKNLRFEGRREAFLDPCEPARDLL